MKKFLVAVISVLWGSSVQAQSKEELLPICIEDSQEIIAYSRALQSGISSIGETLRPRKLAAIFLNIEENELLQRLLKDSLAEGADPKSIELELSSGFARLEKQKDLISDMLEEAFKESLEFEKLSLFISGCTNAFGGEVYTMQEENDALSEENKAVVRKLMASEKALEVAKAGANKYRSQLNVALNTQCKTDAKLQESEAALSNFVTANEQQVALIKDAKKLLAGITSNQSVNAFPEQIAAALAAIKQAEQTSGDLQTRLIARLAEASETPSAPLSVGEKDTFGVAIQKCWNVGSLSSAALETTVVVAVSLARDGKPLTSSIRQIGSEGGTAASVEQAFATARRAIIRCGLSGFKLPSDKYDQWKDLEMTFNPERMRID